MKKLLRFLFSIGTTFSLVSCGLLDGLNETEEDDSTGGFDFGGDSSFQEDTTPSDNNPSPDNPSSDDPSPNPGTETTKTVYRINFYNCGTHLGYLDLEEGTKVDKNTYTKTPSYPTTSNQYQYTFVGWTETRASNDIGSASTYTVNKNVNLHALYSRDLKKYSVTFYYGTTKLGSQDFDYGSVIGTNNAYGYSEKLIKSATGTTYTFIGWNKERPDNDVGTASTYTITADLTLFAVFTSATNSYSVTFINEGVTLGSQSFPFGSKIEKGNMYGYNLSKSSTSQYTYSFDGWHETSTSSSGATYVVTKNMTVHAIYTSAVRQYTVTFKNNGNNVGNPITYTYGQKPSCSITPSKQGSGVTYTFVGWSENPNATATSSNVFPNDNLPTVSKNTTYHAIFSSTTITYQITFKNGNTTLKGPTAVNYNTKPSAPTNNPTKDEEKNNNTGIKYTYAFAGWSTNSNASAGSNNVYASNNLPVATKDDTYYAIFSKTTYYLVTFYNGTTALTTDYYVESGKKPTYSGTQPSKQGSGVTYTFIGWNETSTATTGTLTANLPTVSKKTNYYAIFSSTTNTYQITFKNGNTTLKGPTAVNYNTKPSAPTTTPTKDEEKNNSTGIKYTYAFAGWSTNSNASAGANNVYASNNLPVATKDDTYYAIFSKTTYYLVTFYNGNTALTSDYYVESGKKPTYSGTQPSKQGSGVTYTFIGWNESSTATSGTLTANLPTVSKKTTYYAIFSSTTIEYSVTFMNNGTSLGSQSFPSGSKIKTDNMYGYNVSKSSTAQYTYTFAGWNESSTASSGVEYTVTKNMTVHAIYTSTVRQYSVTFMNGNTTLKGPTSVNYGVRPTAPSNPSKSGTGVTYTFVGWSENPSATATSSNVFASGNLPTVSKDTVYYAIFSSSSGGGTSPETGDTENSKIVDIDRIELDYRGETGDSAFSNQYTLQYGSNNVSNYDITCSLTDEDDSQYFSLTPSSNSVIIKALKANRFTYLDLTCKNKGTQTVAKTQSILLLSNTTDFSVSEFTKNQLGEFTIPQGEYVNVKLENSLTVNDDLVIPSKIKYNGSIKKVGSYTTTKQPSMRKLFFPYTLIHIGTYLFGHRVNKFVHFSESELGFLFIASTSLYLENWTSFFLGDNNTDSIMHDSSNYYFPYAKMGLSSSETWNTGDVTYDNWDFSKDIGGRKKNNSNLTRYLKNTISTNNLYFCN